MTVPDVLDRALGVGAGDRLDRLRRARPETRSNVQLSYQSIFEPEFPGALSVAERFAVAVVVARLHGDTPVTAHYERLFAAVEPRAEVIATLHDVSDYGRTTGPFGQYRESRLGAESTEGLRLTIAADDRQVLGDELTALLEYAHLLVFRPRESGPDELQKLVDVGWTAGEIVAVSQLVAFLSFQIRLAVGLAVLRSTWKA
ncbi:CMD domain protein [Cryobacterium melibiosiphilum]|uniref:CMD domain protein n=1 Tax=Cryobacterium melibiosiphilum TaxID=995039 RepID=A0A3A5MHK5_9MICO|nr:CMD domain protein [Cryobacterium melibiosiphilum]RJT88892.1 CMD domain protein [Cryobacterium melibiosiphilum]